MASKSKGKHQRTQGRPPGALTVAKVREGGGAIVHVLEIAVDCGPAVHRAQTDTGRRTRHKYGGTRPCTSASRLAASSSATYPRARSHCMAHARTSRHSEWRLKFLRVGRRAQGRLVVVGGVGDAPEPQVVLGCGAGAVTAASIDLRASLLLKDEQPQEREHPASSVARVSTTHSHPTLVPPRHHLTLTYHASPQLDWTVA